MYHRDMSLVLAIPSFNRPDSALRASQQLLSSPLPNEVTFLLADNGSNISSYSKVSNFILSKPSAVFLRFEENLGFGLNLLRLIEHVESDYVLLMSDEDHLNTTQLGELLDFLRERNPSLCILRDFDSTRAISKRLRVKHLKGSSNYMSGIVINMNLVRSHIPIVKEMTVTEEYASLYPQVILATILFAEGDSFLFARPEILSRERLETTIRSSGGNPYWYPTERVYQYLSMIRCLEKISSISTLKNGKRIKAFQRVNQGKFFGLLFDAVGILAPDNRKDLTRSSFTTAIHFEFQLFLEWVRKIIKL